MPNPAPTTPPGPAAAPDERVRRSLAELRIAFHSVAHDLRAPLSALRILLAARAPERAASSSAADPGRGAALALLDRLDAQISGLGRLARADAAPLALEEVDVSRTVAEALRNLAAHVERVRPEISLHPLPRVQADPDLLRSVLQNLLENALRFAGRPGVAIEVSAASTPREWVFAVRDDGPGVDAGVRQRLFVPFAAADGGGTGIGLALAKLVVERHGGRIWLESTRGNGTTVYFTLPVGTPATRTEPFPA